jgi:RIO kinase 1
LGKNREHEQLAALDALVERGELDEVLGVVKSGKEATVFCCRAQRGLVAAKVYRSTDVRRFRDDAVYRHGRTHAGRRIGRAVEAKSRAGRAFAFAEWIEAEYETLRLLRGAGADVPEPFGASGSIILMEYIGDDDGPAPMLSGVRLESDEAHRLFDAVLRNIELALSVDRIHGDLSAYNVLYHGGRLRIIDFPQAVDPRFNTNALDLLRRDIENIGGYFSGLGVNVDGWAIAHRLWSRFLRAEL